MKYWVGFVHILFGLIVAMAVSWPFVRMAKSIEACGWSGFLHDCRIVVPKAPEEE